MFARSLSSVVAVATLSYQATGLFRRDLQRSLWSETLQVFKATSLTLLLLLAATYYIQDPYQSRLVTVLFWVSTSLCLLLRRKVTDTLLWLRRRNGATAGKVVIVWDGADRSECGSVAQSQPLAGSGAGRFR